MEHVIGIGEYKISSEPADVLKTFSLGTCVGLVVYSNANRVMGMAHVALPNSDINQMDAADSPARYADKAVDLLVDEMKFRYGCKPSDMKVAVIGGFESRMSDQLKIGERNLEMVKHRLKSLGLRYNDNETGGAVSRTVAAAVRSGEIEITSYPMEDPNK